MKERPMGAVLATIDQASFRAMVQSERRIPRMTTESLFIFLCAVDRRKRREAEEQLTEPRTSVGDFELDEGVVPAEEGVVWLAHLQHLHLQIIVTKEIVDRLLGLMPNVKSLSLSILDSEIGLVEHLPTALGMHTMITELDFNAPLLHDGELSEFLKLCSGSLRTLRSRSPRRSPRVSQPSANALDCVASLSADI